MNKIYNQKARHEYNILETYEAGIVLSGSEVKSIKEGRIKLDSAYIKLLSGVPMLVNCDIPLYKFAKIDDYDASRSRRLLLHKKEIIRLTTKLSSGPRLTIIPLSCYLKKGIIKIEIALVKGKKTWEIKKIEKNRDETKRQQKEIKQWIQK